jgi:hypothetical protein
MTYHLFLCVIGAALQEIFHWLQLRARVGREEAAKLRKSRWEWLLILFVIGLLVPIMAMVWFDGAIKGASKDYFLFGAGVPLILKSGLGASLASDSLVRLGPKSWLRTYLGVA